MSHKASDAIKALNNAVSVKYVKEDGVGYFDVRYSDDPRDTFRFDMDFRPVLHPSHAPSPVYDPAPHIGGMYISNPRKNPRYNLRENPRREEVEDEYRMGLRAASACGTVLRLMTLGGYLPKDMNPSYRVASEEAKNKRNVNKYYSYIRIKGGPSSENLNTREEIRQFHAANTWSDISKEANQFIDAWIAGGRKQPFKHVRIQEWDMYGDGSYMTLLFVPDPLNEGMPGYIFLKTPEAFFDALGVKPLSAIRENPRREGGHVYCECGHDWPVLPYDPNPMLCHMCGKEN